MLSAGLTVRVMSRSAPEQRGLFARPEVQVIAADIADPIALPLAIKGAGTVIHLAHGGRFGWDEIDSSMIEPARRVAEACLKYSVERLVFAGTIESLYLGDPNVTITGSTPTDPRVKERSSYGWGKSRSEALLLRYVSEEALPVCIVRPGVVMGAGGKPFHTGFGQWRNEIHCVGWNSGANPLPLVLASDVAKAIMLALNSEVAFGRTYNLVGDVRLTARECVEVLKTTLERPLVFHPRHPAQAQALALAGWSARTLFWTLFRRRHYPPPSYRRMKSMACLSPFDCTDVKEDLGWQPVANQEEFIERGLRVFGSDRRP
jgi:nucleoside-diphosphate-sugar epimerase